MFDVVVIVLLLAQLFVVQHDCLRLLTCMLLFVELMSFLFVCCSVFKYLLFDIMIVLLFICCICCLVVFGFDCLFRFGLHVCCLFFLFVG